MIWDGVALLEIPPPAFAWGRDDGMGEETYMYLGELYNDQ